MQSESLASCDSLGLNPLSEKQASLAVQVSRFMCHIDFAIHYGTSPTFEQVTCNIKYKSLINFKTAGFVQKILASLDILCKQYSRAGKTVIAVDVLECRVLGPECFCILKIILFAGL